MDAGVSIYMGGGIDTFAFILNPRPGGSVYVVGDVGMHAYTHTNILENGGGIIEFQKMLQCLVGDA